ncbi:sterol desaturase family protein [Spirillospora sp. NPDC052269]
MSLPSLLLLLSAPVFVVGMLVELLVLRRRRMPSYDRRDSALNIATALGNQMVSVPWAIVEAAVLLWLHSVIPWRLDGWAGWAAAMIAVDFAYYWYHRAHHEIRVLWAVHVVHHSSERYNLSVALRQPLLAVTTLPFLIPVVLTGVSPGMLMTCYALNLVYQFFIHTELVDRLWAPVELVFNTPSHHRAHHGSQEQYLDRNYGGILILWDRLFGTFEPEGERVRYGLTTNLGTYDFVRAQTHELVAIAKDVLGATNWPDRVGFVLRGPGWAPKPHLQEAEAAG